MRVTILGAGTAIPSQGYSPAGIYVQIAKERVLLDAGAGTLQRLAAAPSRRGTSSAAGSVPPRSAALWAPWAQLDRIFLTHFHLDHCLDLASVLFAYRLPQIARRKPLTVYGPPGLRRLYRQLNAAFQGWLTPRGFRLHLRELRASRLRLPGYTVQSYPMRHYNTGAIGYRLTAGGKSLGYSGDTDACDGVINLGRRADTLILECSVSDERKVKGHLTPSECGRIAASAGCRHLILTHFYPVFQGYDIRARVRRAYRGRLTLARDFTAFAL